MPAVLNPRSVRRRLYGALAASLLAMLVFEAAEDSTGYWQIAAFALGPDLTLLLGFGTDLVPGQLHPRAVGAYNLAHRFWGPAALVVLASSGVVPLGYLMGGMAWGLHIALDRALGYGLRTPEGFQRD